MTETPEAGYRQRVERAVRDIRAGKAVVVVDGTDREDEGDLVFAAEAATPELLAFTVRHGSGFVCVPMQQADLERLQLPQMCPRSEDPSGTAYAVSVDARHGVGTGISATDRARTIRLLADAGTTPDDLVRPGHVVPLRARPGGVVERAGHTEAAVDLVTMAGMRPVGVVCELVNDDGTMARRPDLERFCREHDLALVTIADLIAHRRQAELEVIGVAARLPTEYGEFRAVAYRTNQGDPEHLALVAGELGDGEDVLVRVHSECLPGDLLGSTSCDCGGQLRTALARVASAGRGVVLYLRGHEGRSTGRLHELLSHHREVAGRAGLPVDAWDCLVARRILADLGVRSMHLMTDDPAAESAPRSRRALVPTTHGTVDVAHLRARRDRTPPTRLGGVSSPARRPLPVAGRAVGT
ncbi:3,4-dihydroxy-2-butanone-4-phosphate synthase [Geodermatophilus sp. TF02-6]|uniref:3,4-dihydroxy-2-butanone-4-phosphate synthase n=1 Tax=Geodermatophilus sp. TF02-6 TaxID=2250575 RepID=UPI000DEB49AC|nr:3,4-dihydroxy-2-butanone-4-phosphate synthase [Geodermatophilus sp. TF02-6]RBY78878.1 3,4-dihydroxy-2-butanone-4-phosphate synthase [Geodermatophilus sp. TF02-6]